MIQPGDKLFSCRLEGEVYMVPAPTRQAADEIMRQYARERGWAPPGSCTEGDPTAIERLFWFETAPGYGYTVGAASLDGAKQEMASRGLSYLRCGSINPPQDDWPPGIWAQLNPPGASE